MKNHPFYGAIVGDIVGSRFEFKPIKTKSFELFDDACQFTDDTVMTVAIANALLDVRAMGRPLGEAAVDAMRSLAERIDEHGFDVGYGCRFQQWVFAETPQPPYHSYGNGSAMRVGAVGLWAATAEEVIDQARAVTVVSHDHPEGVKGAVATALGVWFAGHGWTKEQMRARLGSCTLNCSPPTTPWSVFARTTLSTKHASEPCRRHLRPSSSRRPTRMPSAIQSPWVATPTRWAPLRVPSRVPSTVSRMRSWPVPGRSSPRIFWTESTVSRRRLPRCRSRSSSVM